MLDTVKTGGGTTTRNIGRPRLQSLAASEKTRRTPIAFGFPLASKADAVRIRPRTPSGFGIRDAENVRIAQNLPRF
jgi:hypothetical protein